MHAPSPPRSNAPPGVEFWLNGELRSEAAPLSVASLLDRLELGAGRIAVAINAAVVPRSRFAEVEIASGDRVEMIHAVGGG